MIAIDRELSMVTVWLIALIALVVIELLTMGLTTVWFAGGALVGVVLALIGAPIWLQVIAFLVVSLLLLFFTRPIAAKYFNRDRSRTNVESLIGRQGVVISEIDNLQGIGQVRIDGQVWSARSVEEGVAVPVGAVVVIESISGVKLMVREKGE